MKAALYIRVSTEEQAKEGFSINAQRDRLTKYAEIKDWDVFDLYVDEGLSAKNTERPELQRMLADAKQKKFDVIMFFKLDRFTRSVKDLYQLWEDLARYDVDLHSATEPIDTSSPIGRALMGLLGIFAQLERETIAQRVGFGMEQMVRQGAWHGGPVPFGYEFTGEALVIKEDEAELLRLIYQKYIAGMGEAKLTFWLNEKQLLKNGELWSQSGLNYVLQNPVYVGQLRWNKGKDDYFEVDDSAPAIITREVYDMAQNVRKARSRVHPRQATSIHVFSGRLVCGKCGSPMKGQWFKEKGYGYYLCTAKARKNICDAKQIPALPLEEAFLSRVESWIVEYSDEAKTAAAKQMGKEDNTSEINRLESELDKIKKRRKKWLMDLGNDVITQEEFREMTDEDRQREKIVREQLETIQQEVPEETIAPHEIAGLARNILLQWKFAEPAEKKNLLHILTKRIAATYDKDKKHVTINIEF